MTTNHFANALYPFAVPGLPNFCARALRGGGGSSGPVEANPNFFGLCFGNLAEIGGLVSIQALGDLFGFGHDIFPSLLRLGPFPYR